MGIVPDGIGGIFTAASGAVPWGKDALALGRKRGLMRLALRHGATCMPGYFVGTLQLYTISHDRFGILAALSRRLRLSLFLFHGVALMALSPLCRVAALRFYVAYRKSRLAQRLPDRLARAAGCVAASVLFSVLMLLTSFPAMVLLRLVPLAEVGERLNDCCGGVVVAFQGSS